MDPSFLPTLCFEEVMKYFKGKELLKFMTINQNFHREISSSSILMSKLQLEIREDWMSDFKSLSEIAHTSDRAYSKILISCGDKLMPYILEILSHPQRRWKSLQVFSVSFSSSNELKEFFSYFVATVKSLRLQQIFIRENSILDFGNFTNLKSLKIAFVDSIIYKKILQSSPNLYFLELGFVESITASAVDAIKNLASLKVLHLNKEWMVRLFSSDISDIKFKLKQFDMFFPHNDEELNKENFIKFLETQNELEKLSLLEWFDFEVLAKIFQMKLKELTFYNLPEYGWNVVPVNKSIETLDIQLIYIEPHANNICEILSRVPNLKHLKLRCINEEIATFIAQTMPNIQRISLIHEDISECIRLILPQHVIFN